MTASAREAISSSDSSENAYLRLFGKYAFVLLREENELRGLLVWHVHNLPHAGTSLFPSHEVVQFWQELRLQRLLHCPEERLNNLCEIEVTVKVQGPMPGPHTPGRSGSPSPHGEKSIRLAESTYGVRNPLG